MRDFLCESEYEKRMQGEVLPLLASLADEGFFQTRDNKTLHYVNYLAPTPRGSVVILHGYTESAAKYRELAYYFVRAGLSVLTFDLRGHGDSVREGKKGAVHVSRFQRYVDDLEDFLRTVKGDIATPLYLFAHSMGGAVAALYLEQHSDTFAKAILDAPMIAPIHKGLSYRACRVLCGTAKLFGCGKRPISFLKRPRNGRSFDPSLRSAARAAHYRAFKDAHPTYRVGPATYSWLYEALGVTKTLLRAGAPEGVAVPVLLYAAEHDRLVQSAPQKAFIARVQQGEYILVRGAEHEIFGAVDAVAHPFFESVLDFFET